MPLFLSSHYICTMKKWMAIFVFCVYTFGATDANQLLRLPLLVKHYFKHKADNPDISIAAFLNIHYIQKQEMDADYQQDMQLPFKMHDEAACCASTAVVVPQPITITLPKQETRPVTYIVSNDPMPDFISCKSIFQPPKAA